MNNLRQLSLALHQHHEQARCFPPGHRSITHPDRMPHSGWFFNVLPFLDQPMLHQQPLAAYQVSPSPFRPQPHPGLSSPVATLACPADVRVPGPLTSRLTAEWAAFTSYLGCAGKDGLAYDGVLFNNSHIRLTEISDGTSTTLFIGERPPSADLQYGWWYAGYGLIGDGTADLVLGVREQNRLPVSSKSACGPGAYHFSPSRIDDPCGLFHFWSPHSGGANFAFVDGSVRFLTYTADSLLPDLASRAGGVPGSLP